jgi:hypothetical protein
MTASGMLQVYSRALAVLLVLVALVACGGDDDEPESAAPQKTSEEDGLAAYEVASGGFTISVPQEWKAANIDEVIDEGALDEIRKEDPALADQIEPIAQPGSPVKFVAIDPDIQDDFATNANVYVEEVPEGVTREQYFDATLDQITQALGAPDQDEVTLPAGPALTLAYEQEIASGRQIAILQYVLFENGTGYVLTYTTLPDRSSEYADTFDASARSFAFL